MVLQHSSCQKLKHATDNGSQVAEHMKTTKVTVVIQPHSMGTERKNKVTAQAEMVNISGSQADHRKY